MKLHYQSNSNNRVIFGIFLIIFGCLLVLENLNFFPYGLRHIVFSWPALLLVLGFLFFFTRKDKASGIILMAVGSFFLILLIFDLNFNWRAFLWPSILIIVGIVIIRRRNECKFVEQSAIKGDYDFIDELNILGSSEKMINNRNFRGGKITCIFGGSEINMLSAELSESTNTIDVFTMFGGCILIVPSNWDVKLEVSGILGGVVDKRMPNTNYIFEPKKVLIIKGLVILGGCEIKSHK
ncbi:LiaF transmembrane domain-containing protein [Labilibaculum euxinus]